jgi:hypothetical protein
MIKPFDEEQNPSGSFSIGSLFLSDRAPHFRSVSMVSMVSNFFFKDWFNRSPLCIRQICRVTQNVLFAQAY